MRVLVVEDEPLIAVDIEQIVIEGGHEIAGLAATVEHALSLVGEGAFDAAILDANLAGKSAGPVAEALKERQLPFIAISGYSISQRPRAFCGAPFLSKPFKPAALLAALSDIAA
ncbi:MAG: response regulator [Hyphomicrobium sp.]|jgi:DNA-binding response OmpR family regulator